MEKFEEKFWEEVKGEAKVLEVLELLEPAELGDSGRYPSVRFSWNFFHWQFATGSL